MSKRLVHSLLQDLFGIDLSVGTISEAETVLAAALAPAVEQVQAHVRVAPVVFADETGHREKGAMGWMWVAIAGLISVFLARASRSAQVACELLGPGFAGHAGVGPVCRLCVDRSATPPDLLVALAEGVYENQRTQWRSRAHRRRTAGPCAPLVSFLAPGAGWHPEPRQFCLPYAVSERLHGARAAARQRVRRRAHGQYLPPASQTQASALDVCLDTWRGTDQQSVRANPSPLCHLAQGVLRRAVRAWFTVSGTYDDGCRQLQTTGTQSAGIRHAIGTRSLGTGRRVLSDTGRCDLNAYNPGRGSLSRQSPPFW